MNLKFSLPDIKNKTILFATLDWGMGHTTRSVSVIESLLSAGNKIVFAGNEQQHQFMTREFPHIETVALEGYRVSLDSKKNTYTQLVKQLPKINRIINLENKWVQSFVVSNQVDFVISDNRYGFYHRDIPSIIITHQLNLLVPKFKKIVNKQLAKKVEKFDCCWIPDSPNKLLTGALTEVELKIPTYFIGALNRFQKVEKEVIYDLLVILSGPEPSRTHFLKSALNYVEENQFRAVFVGATVSGYPCVEDPSTNELSELIAESDTVFSRAGYTTIMEMIGLGKKAILIPTKGQYEQEYLAGFVKHPRITFLEIPE